MRNSVANVRQNIETVDKAGCDYWEGIWASVQQLPQPVDPRIKGLNNYVDRHLHSLFKEAFGDMGTEGKRFLEIGCGNSAWLPYFAKEYGFDVSGLDYSNSGCRNAKEILKRAGVVGDVVQGSLFEPRDDMRDMYDVVFSLGLVEHFTDTAACLRACSAFARPGGLMITTIPNMTGIPGALQKYLGREIYDVHVALDSHDLTKSHRAANLKIMRCQYCLFVNLGVLRMLRWRSKPIQVALIRLGSWISKMLWVFDAIVPILRPNRFTSPYILCIAKKRLDSAREISCQRDDAGV